MSNWKKIFISPNQIEAEFIKNELLANEIPAVILNKKDSSYLIGYYEVQVPESQESIAKIIIELFNQDDTNTE